MFYIICKFLYNLFYKSFSKNFLRIQKKNVYPVHKPAAVDYIMFNFDEYLSISKFVWRAFIKESSHLCCTKRKAFGMESHKEINISV
jgi:hypothetical protein